MNKDVFTKNDIKPFVSLKNINKIYPNGIQAVYDFNIDIDEHDFIVLVGPSGCGKSTTLRMVAGLEDITSGDLYIDDVLSNYLPSKDRDISMVFQSYALYPQMTVYDNIAFPLKNRRVIKTKQSTILKVYNQLLSLVVDKEYVKEVILEAKEGKYDSYNTLVYIGTKLNICDDAAKTVLKIDWNLPGETLIAKFEEIIQVEKNALTKAGYTINDDYTLSYNNELVQYKAKLTKEEIRKKVFEAAKILDLGPYLDRRPKELSGGQMQRVALGRAIVRHAKLFLMDEPLSNLDAKLRVQMRSEIVRIHNTVGATTIYVTHDQTEAMTMATKIAVMSKGWVQQIGEPQEIYNRPRNLFVATFIGSPAMNIFDAEYEKGTVYFKNGYSFKMNKEFVDKHDNFYKNQIADLTRMLETPSFKKMKALKYVDEVLFNFEETVDVIKLDELAKEHVSFNILETYNEENRKKVVTDIRKELLQLCEISSYDIGKLHNAQMFNTIVENNEIMLSNNKKKKETKQVQINLHSTDVRFINNLYDVAYELLEKSKEALNSRHPIKLGIRPEDIFLNKECKLKSKTEKFNISAEIVELMGSELLIHTTWNSAKLIAKISTGTLVKPLEEVDLTFNKDKAIVFDLYSGDSIL